MFGALPCSSYHSLTTPLHLTVDLAAKAHIRKRYDEANIIEWRWKWQQWGLNVRAGILSYVADCCALDMELDEEGVQTLPFAKLRVCMEG